MTRRELNEMEINAIINEERPILEGVNNINKNFKELIKIALKNNADRCKSMLSQPLI